MNLSPFSVTSLPVIDGATAGFQYSTAAVGGTATGAIVNNVTVTGDKTFNKQIYWGYRLPIVVTGYPTSGAGINQVQAISTSGRTFKPVTVAASSNMYVAPGVYKIRTAGWIGTATSVSGLWVTYTAPDLVTVTSTVTTANIAVPVPTTYTVSGTIAGIDKISSATGSQMVFLSTDDSDSQYTVYCGQTAGAFSQQMPNGTYIAGIQARGFGSATGTENLGFLNIGTFTVDGGDLTGVELALPNSPTVSGTTTFVGTPPAAITITARDATAPVIDSTAGNIYAPYVISSTWASTTAGNGFTGAYDMQLIQNRNYQMSLAFSLYASTSTTVSSGTVTYTPTLNDVNLDDNETFNFVNLPAPSALVTLSGNLTTSLGAVQGATVTAVATSLTGAPNMTYRATGTTATGTGAWSIKVPKGSYKLYLSSYGTPFVVP